MTFLKQVLWATLMVAGFAFPAWNNKAFAWEQRAPLPHGAAPPDELRQPPWQRTDMNSLRQITYRTQAKPGNCRILLMGLG